MTDTLPEPIDRTRALLVTELFPPAVGGSAVLFHGIYSRLTATDVTVLTDERVSAAAGQVDPFPTGRIVRGALATADWGVVHRSARRHHRAVSRQIRQLMPRGAGLAHAARALPEGIAALIARVLGGPDYVCWAHGEDLATASWSRELTWLTRAVYAGAWAALANSENTARMLETLGVPPRKITVVYPAVDATRFRPDVDGSAVRRRYAGPGDVLLLSVGRLQRRKGHDRVIEALRLLRDEAPTLRYVIAGDGEERPRLEDLVRDCGLRDRVHFAGVIPGADLPAHYAACDAFVLPNRVEARDIEGFGIVFLEAAAAGKPAIGGDSGGVPEAVVRDETGLLVNGEAPADVASAIRRLATDPALRTRLGDAGRARVEQRFTWHRAAAVVAELQARWAREKSRHGGRPIASDRLVAPGLPLSTRARLLQQSGRPYD
jgi:phosphatidyl-myo-inositol dimannoside synthase